VRDTAVVGDLRPSQILFTYGVGASVELPQMSTMVLGLDEWPSDHGLLVSEPRLLGAVRSKLGHQIAELRTPPREDEHSPSAIGVPVSPFPEWLRCPVCKLLAPISSGLFDLVRDRYRAERTRYVHNCRSKGLQPTAYPARFLLACRRGHLDDFPWSEFVHRGQPCAGTLTLTELGTGGGPVDVQIECGTCGLKRRLGDAFGQKAENSLPRRCRGRHPHLGTVGGCEEQVKTILLGASNSWFPVSLSALSIPTREGEVDQKIAARWAVLEKIPSIEVLRYALDTDVQLAGLKEHTPEEVFEAMDRQRSGGDDGAVTADLRLPEWDVLSNPDGAPETEDFRLRVVPPPRRYSNVLSEVVLAEKLREVIALTGFTRVEAPDDLDAGDEQVVAAPMARETPRWLPCTEVRGEGLFLRFNVEALDEWEGRYRASGRPQRLFDAHRQWRQRRGLPADSGQGWPGIRFVALHTLAHALIRELSLECGYGASAIRERIYSPRPDAPEMAGFLLYTAAPDSEGTLGGLVSLGEPDLLGRLLTQALERARLCSSDPLCSEHEAAGDSVHHAACHSCQFASETSCERGNRFLDRAAIVDTFGVTGSALFPS
jgi:hypothetical protein